MDSEMTCEHFLPLAWILPGFLLRWAESVIFAAIGDETEVAA